ncbi:MAG: hypothetical protein A3E83_03125 [Gammaproteobacteria bacterium RIFCSPHIGHO2_12_FULL_41_20]|nr:MAG: hypothetical protein A3E83_03125 [Gammaproteobacteria bacterium RIFCSPHIGHO2_12_FULL_41_20]
MSNKFTIRPLCYTDKEPWLEMWNDYIQFYKTTCSSEVTEHTFNKLLAGDKHIGCLVASENNNVCVGFLTYIAHFTTWKILPVCYLNDLFVKANYRQSGIAKLLLEKLYEIAKNEKWSRIYWLTKPDNKIARQFYDKIAKGDEWVRYILNLDKDTVNS